MPGAYDHLSSLPQPSTAPTRWSLVRRAAGTGDAASHALGEILSHYWYPLYAWARRRGLSEEDAADGVQSFLAKACETQLLARAREERGRLRTWLLRCFQNFLANTADRSRAEKRGAGTVHLSIDRAGAESLYLNEPALTESPDALYRRAWAVSLMEEGLLHLAAHYHSAGRTALYDAILPALDGPLPDQGYAELAVTLGMTSTALRSAVFRMRHRYRDILGTLAAERLGVTSQAALAEELHSFFSGPAQ